MQQIAAFHLKAGRLMLVSYEEGQEKLRKDVRNRSVHDPGRSGQVVSCMHMTTTTGSQQRHSNSASAERRTKPVITPEYIVGLTDGEGCFYVQIRESDRYKVGATVHLHFHIKMKAEDERLLENVKAELNCGEVYFQNDNRDNHADCYRYSVSSHRDILGEIIPFFKENPLQSASKQESFQQFCEIAECVEQKEHLTKEGIEKICKLKKGMN